MKERGSVSIVVAVALGMAAISAALIGDLGAVAAGAAETQAAADAAALAAARELVLPSQETPEEVAARYAALHDARLVRCRCPPGGEDVVVIVERSVPLPFLGGSRTIRRAARATIAIDGDVLGLEPWFLTRLACLADHVPGIWVVSGFRTRAEQARLHREKPGLAAPPGRSQHELGLAADLGFGSAG
ncbi:MAG TPA: M15 family metallopeptidase, partial [Actinomycetota bacterium]|nr:M15 family metallopeptidase [Actinomycetota bacterium]